MYRSTCAALAIAAIAVAGAAGAAHADPIGRPWSASGAFELRGPVEVARCSSRLTGLRDGTSADAVSLTACSGVFTSVTAISPWTVSWNGANTGGTLGVTFDVLYIGTACRYGGGVAFSYGGGTFTLVTSNATRTRGTFPCPSTLSVRGSATLA
jgi:hypothetical protein